MSVRRLQLPIGVALSADDWQRTLTALAIYSGQQAGERNYEAADRTIEVYNAIAHKVRGHAFVPMKRLAGRAAP